MTSTVALTYTILDREFDIDELNDIATHGMSAGVGGFIYSSELADVYDRHEDEITEALDVLASDLGIQSGTQFVINTITQGDDECFYSMQCIKEKSVWMFVEMRALELLRQAEHPNWA